MAESATSEPTTARPARHAREGCALVTGASRGLGAAIARELAAEGWPVALNYRANAQAADAVAAEIRDSGGEATLLPGDVCDPARVEPIFDELEARFGRVLILVNNAGIRRDALAPQLSDDDWAELIETNLTAAFRLTRRALRPMIRARFGRVINIASVIGQRANPGQAGYAAAKAGLIGMTKTVAVEVARRGVTVNAVAPGLIATDMTEGLEEVAAVIPARRLGTPADVAACVRFLASEDASYVTGSVLTVDGGLTA
jgi:3-oxoacyl-[acyl-carrier protein] reductase